MIYIFILLYEFTVEVIINILFSFHIEITTEAFSIFNELAVTVIRFKGR